MAPGVDKLPDFSKGEEVNHSPPNEFQPLFGKTPDPQDWFADSAAANDDSCDDLAALVSELNQLPVEPIDDVGGEPTDLKTDSAEPLTSSLSSSDMLPADEHEAAMEALKQEHAQELQRLQTEHNEQVMQHLENVQNGLMNDVAGQIEGVLAEALTPLFQRDISRTSLDQLLTEVRRIIQSESVERISLSGPETLIAAASKALAGTAVVIDVEPADVSDLVVHLNQKILSTCIEDWSRKVEEALIE